jgi:uncharacterized protein YraI
MTFRISPGRRRAARAALAAGTLALAVTGAMATTASASTSSADDIGANCFITTNNVNYRSGPGTQYPSYGQVNQGQGFYTYSNVGRWLHGDLWGGRKDVWINADFCAT